MFKNNPSLHYFQLRCSWHFGRLMILSTVTLKRRLQGSIIVLKVNFKTGSNRQSQHRSVSILWSLVVWFKSGLNDFKAPHGKDRTLVNINNPLLSFSPLHNLFALRDDQAWGLKLIVSSHAFGKKTNEISLKKCQVDTCHWTDSQPPEGYWDQDWRHPSFNSGPKLWPAAAWRASAGVKTKKDSCPVCLSWPRAFLSQILSFKIELVPSISVERCEIWICILLKRSWFQSSQWSSSCSLPSGVWSSPFNLAKTDQNE